MNKVKDSYNVTHSRSWWARRPCLTATTSDGSWERRSSSGRLSRPRAKASDGRGLLPTPTFCWSRSARRPRRGPCTSCRDGGVLVRYWGSRPELATKLRVTVGTKESVDKFVSIVTQALPSLEGM